MKIFDIYMHAVEKNHQRMKKISDSIGRDKGFEDLAEICDKIQGMQREQLIELIDDEYSSSASKQSLYLVLQKMNNLQYHAAMGKMMHQ